MHLLHLEDSINDAELVEDLVRREWPDCQFKRVERRADFKNALEQEKFTLILSDYTLPDFDGLSALKLARECRPDTPFIFLSGTIGEERAIEALKRGASDYVIKDRPNRIVPAIRQALAHAEETQRHRLATERIREQAALLDKARDAICVTDLAHTVTYWNASAEQLYGWTAAEAIGRDLRGLLFPDDPGAYDEPSKKLRMAGEWQGELQPRTKTGVPRIVDCNSSFVPPTDNQAPGHILLICTDVTEKKKFEAELLRTQRMESIGSLAAGIAHDLNNVFHPILIAAGLMRHNPKNVDVNDLAASIETGAQHGAALIKQLLAFARGAEGEHTRIQLRQFIADLDQLLQTMLPRTIRLNLFCEEGLWPISGDTTQLKQVMVNLCVNSRDAMPDGGSIEIAARNFLIDETFARSLPECRPGRYVCITVTDTGSGIPPAIIDRIFDPFFTTKELGKGTGLGLSAVRGILKGHGGRLQVESKVGRGTTFRLYLPALAEATRPPVSSLPPFTPLRAGEGVLLVDDDRAVLKILRLLLERVGCHVFTGSDGFEAVAVFKEHRDKINLVIMDMMMPGMGGPEAIAALRKISPELPVIAISGLMETNRANVGRLPGPPIECLSKPVTADVLFGAIGRTLHRVPAEV
jgi:two-component system, cell cycle sensor histidine kinase and response regulator CckA